MPSTPTEIDAQTLEKVSQLEVHDEKGDKVTFGSIFDSKKTVVVFIRGSHDTTTLCIQSDCLTSRSKVISSVGYVMPIRVAADLRPSFAASYIPPAEPFLDLQGTYVGYVGLASALSPFEQYVSQIASTVRTEALEEANVDVVLVGCGEWELIKEYKGV